MTKRYEELDSLRGIAAFVVLFGHVLMLNAVFLENTYGNTDYWLVNAVKYSPLHIFFAGNEAVMLFFILSGFVLALPFLKGKDTNYTAYLVKRLCRIYIPYIVAVLIGIGFALYFSRGGAEGYETHRMFLSTVDVGLVLNHIFMIGVYDTAAINPPIWSLVHEMRISLIFPLLMVLIIRLDWKKVMLIAAALSISSLVINVLFPPDNPAVSFEKTFHYISLFLMGALLAKHKDDLIVRFQQTKRSLRPVLATTGVMMFTYPFWFISDSFLLHNFVVNDWIVAGGAAIFILSSLSFKGVSTVLTKRPFLLLGRISYSLYLVHAIVMFVVIKLIGTSLPFPMTGVIIIVASLLVAYFFSNLVEKTSIKLGRKLSKRTESSSRGRGLKKAN